MGTTALFGRSLFVSGHVLGRSFKVLSLVAVLPASLALADYKSIPSTGPGAAAAQVPTPRQVALDAYLAEQPHPFRSPQTNHAPQAAIQGDPFAGVAPEDRPPAKFSFNPVMVGMYTPSSPFVNTDGLMRAASLGGLMLLRDKKGTPVAQINGATLPGTGVSYGMITFKDLYTANGRVNAQENFYIVSHEQRIKVYRQSLNRWIALEGYSWAHFSSLGTLDFKVMDLQAGGGLGVGVSFKPNEESRKRGTMFQMSVSGGPGARFSHDIESSTRTRPAVAGFLNLTAVY